MSERKSRWIDLQEEIANKDGVAALASARLLRMEVSSWLSEDRLPGSYDEEAQAREAVNQVIDMLLGEIEEMSAEKICAKDKVAAQLEYWTMEGAGIMRLLTGRSGHEQLDELKQFIDFMNWAEKQPSVVSTRQETQDK